VNLLSPANQQVRVWEETVSIPTYGIGEPDKNPMFLEKRVYQGSSGRVYPHPVIESIADEKKPQDYLMVILENEYVRIEIMPELGGRIYRALDKTNDYDFVYYNRVIKPALVGLAGPWISGGIEFNWPQHHRPNTYGPVEYRTVTNEDGSATVWVSEIDRMYGTKVTAGFTLHPGKAYLEIHAQLYNRTPEPQTFLWWANPAVAVNDHTQSVFPPDVTAVFDHGKRDVSRFPIATGTYYKMDYSEGVDISRYKNIPVPTSYMAYKSDYNFVGGYDHGVGAGLLHVANHHVSPGKKQWTWGNGEFGQAWDRNLTDEDGPYIELMTGVYTDNQPDFTWLQPYEEKSFTQYFMPYKNIGVVKNATIDAAVNLEIDEATRIAVVQAYTTSLYAGATIEVKSSRRIYLQETTTLSPTDTFKSILTIDEADQAHEIKVTIRDANGVLLVSYQPKKAEIEQIPDAAKPLPAPEELKTIEQLYLAGLHLEQYRHATFEPEAYYLEGLKRDSSDIRINIAYGTLLLRRGQFTESEAHFRKAVQSVSWRNTNPYDSEAHYQLGVSLKQQGRLEEAFAVFYKAVWSAAWQDSGYYSLAQIACWKQSFAEALELVERSLIRNTRNYKARHLKTTLLRKLGRIEEALQFAKETLALDNADFGAQNEVYLLLLQQNDTALAEKALKELTRFMRNDIHNYLHLGADYAGSGLFVEAIAVLERLSTTGDTYPMLHYTLGYLYEKTGLLEKAKLQRIAGQQAPSDYCFPNTLFDLEVLIHAVTARPEDDKANYYLGNWYYDKKRPEAAIQHWEASRANQGEFATVHRNLALAYFNKKHDSQAALASLEKAFACQTEDARVFFELDQLYKKLGHPAEQRFAKLEKYKSLVEKRDDLYLEYITLLNSLGQHEQAIETISSRTFHPWEGGEGKVTGQYIFAHVELGKRVLAKGDFERAISLLEKALVYPHNLGEGKLTGAQENHIYYYLGCAHEGLKQSEQAKQCFSLASLGLAEPASAMFYNDQPPDMIFYQGMAWLKLQNDKEAKRRFNKLIDYAEQHMFDEVKIDYFAVSLPDFLVFEDDLNQRNQIHCRYMRGLGLIGLQQNEQAIAELDEVLRLNLNHQGASVSRQMIL
jgi:tetratricopeptide (TPR) repeat protein